LESVLRGSHRCGLCRGPADLERDDVSRTPGRSDHLAEPLVRIARTELLGFLDCGVDLRGIEIGGHGRTDIMGGKLHAVTSCLSSAAFCFRIMFRASSSGVIANRNSGASWSRASTLRQPAAVHIAELEAVDLQKPAHRRLNRKHVLYELLACDERRSQQL
jgi:hypothetical protein